MKESSNVSFHSKKRKEERCPSTPTLQEEMIKG
jgi:hypothetical protein